MRRVTLTWAEKIDCKFYIDQMLFGRESMKPFFSFTNKNPTPSDRDKAKLIYMLKYELKEYFGIDTPDSVLEMTEEQFKKTGLFRKIKQILLNDVPEINGVDPVYITRLLFPGHFKETDDEFLKEMAQNYFSDETDSGRSLANQYFSKKLYPETAEKKACWCLEIILNRDFTSIEEMYKAFSSSSINTYLRKQHLLGAMTGCGYEFPIDYLHETIKDDKHHTESNELLYQMNRWKLKMLDVINEEKKEKTNAKNKLRTIRKNA